MIQSKRAASSLADLQEEDKFDYYEARQGTRQMRQRKSCLMTISFYGALCRRPLIHSHNIESPLFLLHPMAFPNMKYFGPGGSQREITGN